MPRPASFRELYDEHFAYTWRSLRYLGVPESQLEDASQELWLVVSRRLADFEQRSHVRTWLFGIAINLSRNLRRVQSRRRPHVPLPLELTAAGGDPCSRREANEGWEMVSRFLDTLDDTRRAIFVGALLEQWSPVELSPVLGLDATAVQNRVRSLRRSFERWVKRQESPI